MEDGVKDKETDGVDILSLLERTERAVVAAGEIIKEAWERPRSVQRKGRIDLVTETDLAVEAALKESLAAFVPEALFMAEESCAVETRAPDSGYVWVIDPLDGTTNFVHALPFVAISTALCHNGAPILSVVYNPALNELFRAGRGYGAFLNGRKIRVSTAERLEAGVVATGFPYTIDRDVDELLLYLRRILPLCQGIRRYGVASLDLAYTAASRLDAFYEIGLKPWDTAGGWLLVEEAEGQVSQFDLESPYRLGARTILASNGRIHREMSMMLTA